MKKTIAHLKMDQQLVQIKAKASRKINGGGGDFIIEDAIDGN